jgi:hypothetical protein
MDVKTFVSETLKQIVEGVEEAQQTPSGAAINAQIGHGQPGGNLLYAPGGMATRVDFDIAISAETEGGAKGGLKVISVLQAEGGGAHKTGYANRITFSVPILLPRAKS